MKKLLAAVLAVCTVLSMLILPATATTTTGMDIATTVGYSVDLVEAVDMTTITQDLKDFSDTSETPSGNYKITTVQGWKNFAAWVNAGNTFEGCTVYLANDIGSENDKIEDIIVGKTSTTQFGGNFDGQGYTIDYFICGNNDSLAVGLFGYQSAGTIKNVKMGSNSTITVTSYSVGVGSFVGYTAWANTSIQNVYSAATIKVTGSVNNTGVGGILGHKQTGNVTVTVSNCTFSGTLTMENVSGAMGIGGIFGRVNGLNKISYCENQGQVTSTGNNQNGRTGGIVGDGVNALDISYCMNSGSVSGYGDTGGIVGMIEAANSVIAFCENTGAVKCTYSRGAGGIVGRGWAAATVSDCKNYGAITSSNNNASAGGIVGVYTAGSAFTLTIARCNNYGTITNTKTVTPVQKGIVQENIAPTLLTIDIQNCNDYSDKAWIKGIQKGEAYNKEGDAETVYQDVRVIGIIDSLNYEKVGFEIVVKNGSDQTVQTVNLDCKYVYTSLIAMEDGSNTTYKASDDRTNGYYFAVVIEGIPVASYDELTFEIKTYTVAEGGTDNLYGENGSATVTLDKTVKKN